MTNFESIKGYRRLIAEHGDLLSYGSGYKFAGVSQQRWNQLRRRGQILLVKFQDELFVPLSFIEKRNLKPGRVGVITQFRNGLLPYERKDWPKPFRQKKPLQYGADGLLKKQRVRK